jgi:hypothetical protein
MERLGEKPLARLVSLQERAVERLKTRTIEEAGEAHQIMCEALTLTRLLAEGAESRDWTDDDQEGGSGEGAAGQGQAVGKGAAGQGAAGQGDQEGEGATGEGAGEADQDGGAGAAGVGERERVIRWVCAYS